MQALQVNPWPLLCPLVPGRRATLLLGLPELKVCLRTYYPGAGTPQICEAGPERPSKNCVGDSA